MSKIKEKIAQKILEHRAINTIKEKNLQLLTTIHEMEELEFIYDPRFPNRNTPFSLIDFESITKFKVYENLVIAHTPFEVYSLNIKSDEYFFEFIKKLIVVGEKTLIGKERLIMNHKYYNFKIDLTEDVDVMNIRKLVYQYHRVPKKKIKESIVSHITFDDSTHEEQLKRIERRYGGAATYTDGRLIFK